MAAREKRDEKIERILEAFQEHLQTKSNLEICFSEQCGYLFTAEGPLGREGPARLVQGEDLLWLLFGEIRTDTMGEFLWESPRPPEELSLEIRRRITRYLRRMGPDTEAGLACLDAWLAGEPFPGWEEEWGL